MRAITTFVLILFVAGCSSGPPPRPKINVEKDLFDAQHWNVAVLDLNYKEMDGQGFAGAAVYSSGGPDAGRIVASLLANELSALNNVTIVERGQIEELINEQELQMSGVISSRSAVQIGEVLGANAVVVGDVTEWVNWTSIGLHGSTVSFSMRMIETESGRVVLNGANSKVANFTTPFQNAQELTRELIQDIFKY